MCVIGRKQEIVYLFALKKPGDLGHSKYKKYTFFKDFTESLLKCVGSPELPPRFTGGRQ